MIAKEKIKTGVPGLDEMLQGGLIPGRPYIVSGQLGTGKTTLAIQFLLEGVKNGENVLYITTEEPPNEIKKNFASFNWDISKIKVFDAIPDVMTYEITPIKDITAIREIVAFKDVPDEIRKTPEHGSPEMTFNALQNALRLALSTSDFQRIVVDSLTALKFFCIPSYDHNLGVQSFIRFLSELKVTALLTVEMPLEYQFEPELFLARGEIRLLKWRDKSGELKRGILIEKYKGSPHDIHLRPMEITSDGIVVYSELHVEKSPLEAYLEAIPIAEEAEEGKEEGVEKEEAMASQKENVTISGSNEKFEAMPPAPAAPPPPAQPAETNLALTKNVAEPIPSAETQPSDAIGQAEIEAMLKEMRILREDANDASLIGITVEDILGMIDKAEPLISQGKFREAKETVKNARNLLDERINQFHTLAETQKVSGEKPLLSEPPKAESQAEVKAEETEKPAKKTRKKREKKETPEKEKKGRKRKTSKKEVSPDAR